MSDLSGYLPEFMAEIDEFKEIFSAENMAIDKINNELEKIFSEGFIDSLSEYGCKRWESILGIKSTVYDSLERRRIRIKTALSGDTPYTFRSLEKRLEVLCGENNFDVSYSNDEYTLRILIGLKAKDMLEFIKEMVYYMIPADIVPDISLDINRHRNIKNTRHKDLRDLSHNEIIFTVFEL